MFGFRSLLEIIRFLQQQYAGSTSTTAWERYELNLSKLLTDRLEWDKKTQEVNEEYEKVKLQQEILSSRLKIVERLKDMLEQQIGSPDVESIMQRFSEDSQRTLSVSILKLINLKKDFTVHYKSLKNIIYILGL